MLILIGDKECRSLLRYRRALLLLWLLLPISVAEGAAVWFLYDNKNRHHQEYVEESGKQLRLKLPSLETRYLDRQEFVELSKEVSIKPLLVSVGMMAAKESLASGMPTMATFVTNAEFASLRSQYKTSASAIYLDLPVAHYLHLINCALPKSHRVTVMQGVNTQLSGDELALQAKGVGLALQVIDLKSGVGVNEIFARMLRSGEPLLLLPDRDVVNSHTVKPLVLGSYRQGVPLIAYSQSLVKAGALMAAHSTMEGMERQLVEMVLAYLTSGNLPGPRYADEFVVSVNYQLARALKLSLPTEKQLQQMVLERAK